MPIQNPKRLFCYFVSRYKAESYKYCIIIAGRNTKISKTHRLLNRILFSLCLSLCLMGLVLPVAEFFHFLDTVLREFYTSQVIICTVYSFVFWFKNSFLQVKQARYHTACIKKLCDVMCDVIWLSPKALPSLHYFVSIVSQLTPTRPNDLKHGKQPRKTKIG